MSIYVIIGFDFTRDLIINDSDRVLYEKIYILTHKGLTDNSDIEIISEVNALDFYIEEKFDTLDKNVIFIDCRGHHTSYLEVMNFLGTSRFDKRNYYVHNPKNILKISDYMYKEQFDPWMGDKIPTSVSETERKFINKMYLILSKVVRSYLKYGFHESQIRGVPDGWMMNINNFELESVIRYYGLYPITPDVHKSIEFVHNAQYRQILTKTLVHIVSNFFVRNNILSPVDDWFSYKNWSL